MQMVEDLTKIQYRTILMRSIECLCFRIKCLSVQMCVLLQKSNNHLKDILQIHLFRVHCLGLQKKSLIGDLNTFGFLFEALCERDLRIYAESIDAKLFHYQDYSNKEIDAIVQYQDGRWGAFEIKLGANQIDAAAENLIKIKKEFEEDNKAIPPTFLCVICGMSNSVYTRPDGVIVIPITALKN